STDLQSDVMANAPVAAVMSSPVVAVSAEVTPVDAVELVEASGHSAYPMVGRVGRLEGIVTRAQLLSAEAVTAGSLVDTAPSDVVTDGHDARGGDVRRLRRSATPARMPLLDSSVRHGG